MNKLYKLYNNYIAWKKYHSFICQKQQCDAKASLLSFLFLPLWCVLSFFLIFFVCKHFMLGFSIFLYLPGPGIWAWYTDSDSEWHGPLITHYFVSIFSWVWKVRSLALGVGMTCRVRWYTFSILCLNVCFFVIVCRWVWSHYFASILGWVLEGSKAGSGR